MKLADFNYTLPQDQIAQNPLTDRSASRLMVLNREMGKRYQESIPGTWEHRRFTDLKEYLRQGDALVFNDTKVIPARLIGRRARTGGNVECLLIDRVGHSTYRTLIQPSRGIRVGTALSFPSSAMTAQIVEDQKDCKLIQFNSVSDPEGELRQIGKMPLPPYIKREPNATDEERYQTVYAKNEGAIAAPTAGLHFTDPLLKAIMAQGVRLCYVTLHVGPGTFLPVRSEDPRNHRLWPERFRVSEESVEELNQARRSGGRIVAVGTTSARVLETIVDENGCFRPDQSETDLFILPGYQFRAVDALVTNFHLPRTTLLMLVSAFATREWILEAYQDAIREGYRFYSYGDAMFIL